MERHDETGARTAADLAGGRDDLRGHRESDAETGAEYAAERIERDQPASPEQTGEGFETGYDQKRDTPEELQEPNFARGISAEDPPGGGEEGRFSRGIEEDPADPENNIERRFSEGIERSPTSE